MDRSTSKAVRLAQLQYLLFHGHPGLTVADLAERLSVSRRTVHRDLSILESQLGVPLTQNGRRYSIVQDYILPPIAFSLQEARTLLLATCLFLRYSDEGDPHGIKALNRLSTVLPSPVARRVERMVASLKTRPVREHLVRVLETITEAWAACRVLRINYYSRQNPLSHEAEVEPYLIEASAYGYSTYLIGYSRTHGQLRTFKVERILQAEIKDESFTPPGDHDLEDRIERGWGIIWGDETDQEEIELRFTVQVARRVQEAIWHPSQRLTCLPDGSCCLTLRVPSQVEVLPWIRSWGPDVEVKRPQSLRDILAMEAAKATDIYGGRDD